MTSEILVSVEIDVDEETLAALMQATGGNSRFIEALVRMAIVEFGETENDHAT